MGDNLVAAVMGGKRPYYRLTTPDQRKLAFAVYEQTDSPRKACEAAHIGRGTFYKWLPRFLAGGYAALEQTGSHRPHTFPRQLPDSVLEAVLAAKREHPEWGKQRIADELAKAHGWQPLVSPSEVRRMLIEAGLWSQVARDPRVVGVRHAELPNQTVNTDLCFVPATHQVAEAVPAVSGSSGRLIVSPPKEKLAERTWPGRAFEQSDVSYAEAMDGFIAARVEALAEPTTCPAPRPRPRLSGEPSTKPRDGR